MFFIGVHCVNFSALLVPSTLCRKPYPISSPKANDVEVNNEYVDEVFFVEDEEAESDHLEHHREGGTWYIAITEFLAAQWDQEEEAESADEAFAAKAEDDQWRILVQDLDRREEEAEMADEAQRAVEAQMAEEVRRLEETIRRDNGPSSWKTE
jgi:hypothetical protein